MSRKLKPKIPYKEEYFESKVICENDHNLMLKEKDKLINCFKKTRFNKNSDFRT